MECIPAIDLKGGKCVRLTQGKFDQQNLYSDDPVKIAKRWVDEGATRLHIIDLDGARTGSPSTEHLVIIRDIMRRLKVPIQLGGGIRTREVVDRMINIGIDRVILGTAAVSDPLVGEIFRDFGDKVIVGIDARDGIVAVSGWEQTTGVSAIEFAKKVESIGAKRIIFTDIARDGMLQGVNVQACLGVMRAISIPMIAAGGVSSEKDIVELKAAGAEGAILGKALYENMLRLPDAIAAAAREIPTGGSPFVQPSAPLVAPVSAPPSAPRPAQPAQAQQVPVQQNVVRPPAPPAQPGPAKPYLPWANPPKR
jgi:phosphoribosylformimino-5-aminoimidazole carboxamide ribotide isomerase